MIDYAGLLVGLLLWCCGLVIAWIFTGDESPPKSGFINGLSFKSIWNKWVK